MYESFESGYFWALQSSKALSYSPPQGPHRLLIFSADKRTLSRRCWRSPAGLPARLWKIGEGRRIGQRHWCRLRQGWSYVAMAHRHACPCPRGRRPQQSPMPASPSRVAAPSLYSRVGGDGGGGGRSGGSDEEDDVARSRERRAICLFLVLFRHKALQTDPCGGCRAQLTRLIQYYRTKERRASLAPRMHLHASIGIHGTQRRLHAGQVKMAR